jgi:hypothetical protein
MLVGAGTCVIACRSHDGLLNLARPRRAGQGRGSIADRTIKRSSAISELHRYFDTCDEYVSNVRPWVAEPL